MGGIISEFQPVVIPTRSYKQVEEAIETERDTFNSKEDFGSGFNYYGPLPDNIEDVGREEGSDFHQGSGYIEFSEPVDPDLMEKVLEKTWEGNGNKIKLKECNSVGRKHYLVVDEEIDSIFNSEARIYDNRLVYWEKEHKDELVRTACEYAQQID